MGLQSLYSFNNKENAPPSPLSARNSFINGIMKKKRSPRKRRRRVPLQDITHLFNYNNFHLFSPQSDLSSFSSASRIHVLGCNRKKRSADLVENNGNQALVHARISVMLRKEFR
ncbi:hypothetical protein KFK09_027200 [Dendrobium nobile]|uniref:Uncharacterized protein n=1 Tax=Dendrobium nobile TaxID=94219 RepID=A0A8T3AA52_DENNO|nr:hypothetical protein KFK09_027200 [Dendrobium nobile]